MKLRVRFVCAVAAATLLASGATASAQGSPRIFEPSGPLDLPAGYCAFPVHVDNVFNKEYIDHQWTNRDGSLTILSTGALILRVTNTTTGKTITVNASGPLKVTIYPDGSEAGTVLGPFFHWFDQTDQQRFGVPGLALINGRGAFTTDPSGTLTSASFVGHVTDLCAALS
jgi:hypothetical protein